MSIYQPSVITEEIIKRFTPTRLYIKRHRKTGLLYFGKTGRQDIEVYLGSGLHWSRHLAIHGNHVETCWVSRWFDSPYDIQDLALYVSKTFDIVNDDKWANMKPENGLDGGRMSDDSLAARLTVWNLMVCCSFCRKEFSYPNFIMYHGIHCPDNPSRVESNRPSTKGERNGRFISTEFDFLNVVTGEIVTSTRYGMTQTFGVSAKAIHHLVHGDTKELEGWQMVTPPSFPAEFDKIFDFYHLFTGEHLHCTAAEFWHLGLADRKLLGAFINGLRKHRMLNNWVLSLVPIYRFKNKISNEEVIATIHGLGSHTGLPHRVLGRIPDPNERMKSYKGWFIVDRVR